MIDAIYHFIQSIGLYGVFGSVFLENIGIAHPTVVVYIIGRDLIAKDAYSYSVVLATLTSGHVIGSLVSYQIGRMGNNYVTRKIRANSKIREIQEKLQGWYERYGSLTVFLTRFVGYVRPWSSFVAGFAKIDFWPFLLWTIFGSLLFNIFNLYFAKIFIAIWLRYTAYHFWIGLILILSFFGFVIYGLIKHLISTKRRPELKK